MTLTESKFILCAVFDAPESVATAIADDVGSALVFTDAHLNLDSGGDKDHLLEVETDTRGDAEFVERLVKGLFIKYGITNFRAGH